MVDPEVDHEFAYDSQGQIDILRLPFFDPHWEFVDSVEDYVDCILYHLAEIIDLQRPSGQLAIIRRSSPPPSPTTLPWIKTIDVVTFFVASFGVLKISLR
ncbi:hypothetical protein M5K25_017596 [Dendrobium thyrsiflorum]|uniref:Uncharacterized protein n=1 Tax=Dendrobium thyrsiflorum TaxID=117978 RepID=A0ABD0UUG2_DENTH